MKLKKRDRNRAPLCACGPSLTWSIYIAYTYIYKYIYRLIVLFGWLVIFWWKKYTYIWISLAQFFDVPFSIYYFIYVRPTVEKNNKIDVLSEEPCPLHRGGVTGRANRLMMCDDKDDDARDGPALRSSGTRLVSEVSRVREITAWHWVHLPPTTFYYLRSDTWWNPVTR